MAEKPEKVDVKRVRKLARRPPAEPGLPQRLYNAVFPILGGLILDFADLATFGPIGIYTGMIVGGVIGWLISDIYGFSKSGRTICSVLAGLYCMVPGTFFLPLATVVSAVARFNRRQ